MFQVLAPPHGHGSLVYPPPLLVIPPLPLWCGVVVTSLPPSVVWCGRHPLTCYPGRTPAPPCGVVWSSSIGIAYRCANRASSGKCR